MSSRKSPRSVLPGLIILLFFMPPLCAQELPIGYTSYFQNSGKSMSFINSLETSESAFWKISKYGATIISPVPDSLETSFPENKGFIQNMILGEYIMEFEFRVIDNDPAAGSGFYLLTPARSCSDYYAFNFGTDSLRFFYVDEDSITHLSSKKLEVDIAEWTKIRVDRDILKRKVSLTLTGETTQKLNFSDRRLIMGYMGFGTQNVNSAIRNIRLWAPTAKQDEIIECE